ncbi:hypothetical protein [Streptomyces chryseus]
MAKPKTTDPRTNTPPEVGKTVTVRVADEGMRDDLAVMMRAHPTASDAVRQALLLVANAYYAAWEGGHYPPGVMPQIVRMELAPYEPVRQPDQAV